MEERLAAEGEVLVDEAVAVVPVVAEDVDEVVGDKYCYIRTFVNFNLKSISHNKSSQDTKLKFLDRLLRQDMENNIA